MTTKAPTVKQACASRARPGFSLMEIIIVLFLTSMLLLAISRLLSQTLGTLQFLQEKGQTSESASLGCERLASELTEAVKVTLKPSDEVSFSKVSASAHDAIDNSPATDASTWLRVYPTNQLVNVTYNVDSDSNLKRVAGLEPASTVATEVNTFVVKPYSGGGSGTFLLTLSLQEKRRVVTFETIVTAPALQDHLAPGETP